MSSVHEVGPEEDSACAAEIARRVEEIERGVGVLVPAEVAFAQVRNGLRDADAGALAKAWAEEISNRKEALLSGADTPVSWADAKARLSSL